MIDNNPLTVALVAGNGRLHQMHRGGRLWRYTGTPCSGDSCPGWQLIDNNTATEAMVSGTAARSR
jgi:hypothetical protein